MDRKYKAFISYRHLPLDKRTAKKVHRYIEHYTLSKELRVNTAKHVGYLFRDKDELSASACLTDKIMEALDNSEFLLVICTPDTANSKWVNKEIDYFIDSRDGDSSHVRAIIAEGQSGDVIPERLKSTVGRKDGTTISQDPLAANLVAPFFKRMFIFEREILRIIAALVPCDYDDLYKRELRYNILRILSATAAITLTAALFIGMLLNRNKEIAAQLRASQINESKMLAAMSEASYQEGDYCGAINLALQALPSESNVRPYVPKAEDVLSNELKLYETGYLGFYQSVDQETDISNVDMSDDGVYTVTTDFAGDIRLYDSSNGKRLWKYVSNEVMCFADYVDKYRTVFVGGTESSMLSMSGQRIWATGKTEYVPDSYSPASDNWLGYTRDEKNISLHLMRLEDGEEEQKTILAPSNYGYISKGTISDDGKYAAVLLSQYNEDRYSLYVYDVTLNSITEIDKDFFCLAQADYALTFTDENNLLVAYDTTADNARVFCFEKSNNWMRKFNELIEKDDEYLRLTGDVALLDSCEKYIVCCSNKNAVFLDKETGEKHAIAVLPSAIVSAKMYQSGYLGLVLKSGVITICTQDGLTGLTADTLSFDCGYQLSAGAICGQPYVESRFALVSIRNQKMVTFVNTAKNSDLIPIVQDGTSSYSDKSHFCTSPSGKLIAYVRYDLESGSLLGGVVDCTNGYTINTFTFDADDTFIYQDEFFVTDDGKIIVEDTVFDTVTGEQHILIESGGSDRFNYCNVKNPKESSVVTAKMHTDKQDESCVISIWKDGILVCEEKCPEDIIADYAYSKCIAVGANGYVLISQNGGNNASYAVYSVADNRWVNLPTLFSDSEYVISLSEVEPYLAVLNSSGTIKLIDAVTANVFKEFECELPSEDVSKLLFACDDKILLLFSQSGILQIYSTESGEIVHESTYDGSFGFGARFEVYEEAGNQRICITYDNPINYMPVTICIERDTWQRVGTYHGMAHYIKDNGEVIIMPREDGMYMCNMFTLKDIMDKGEKVVLKNE